jgi:hypothetical protein
VDPVQGKEHDVNFNHTGQNAFYSVVDYSGP